jgi:hypothetical protein
MAETSWDWSQLPVQDRSARWMTLVKWVRWLQEIYEPWVKLPECWPRHEALRSELEFFRAWREDIMKSGTPSDGTYWHSSLRNAAAAWEQLANCTHEERPWRTDRRNQTDRFREHLQVAMASNAIAAPR